MGTRTIKTIHSNVVIFDLDGCLFDDRWRLPKINRAIEQGKIGNAVYEQYHRCLEYDQPIKGNLEVLRAAANNGHKIAFVTARPDMHNIREKTIRSIRANLGIHVGEDIGDAILIMRHADDQRASPILKEEALAHIRDNLSDHEISVIAAYDDRADVVEMYRKNGVAASVLDYNGLRAPITVNGTVSVEGDVSITGSLPMVPIHPEVTASIEGRGEIKEKTTSIGDFHKRPTAADILASAADTFRERNENYKDNAVLLGQLQELFFPGGVQLKTAADHHFYHLFELAMVKLTRFVKSDLRHTDSLRDLAVYIAMLEPIADAHNIKILPQIHFVKPESK